MPSCLCSGAAKLALQAGQQVEPELLQKGMMAATCDETRSRLDSESLEFLSKTTGAQLHKQFFSHNHLAL